MPEGKLCPRCRNVLPFDAFYYNKKKHCYLSYCKECMSRLAHERYAREHGDNVRKCRHYSDEEITMVIDNYQHKRVAEIAAMLDRSVSSVRKRAAIMGLKKKY